MHNISEDFLPILENEGDNAASAGGRTKILCFREGGAGERKDGDEPSFPNDSQFRLDCKLVYQKAAIYFSIQAKAQLQRQVGIWFASIGCISGSYGGEWKVKCRDFGSDYGSGSNLCGNFGQDGSSWNHRMYESSTGLHKYRASVTFSASSGQGGSLNTRNYFISDRW